MITNENEIRPGLKDIWNAHMCKGADFSKSKYDIPFCPTTATKIPSEIINWEIAKSIYKKAIVKKDKSFHYGAFVCFYIDDYKFDGPRGIWHYDKHALEVIKHFDGVITPDFSTYQDFPEPIKIYNTYRMRIFGYWLTQNGIEVINNVRWGTRETWRYCWDGIPKRSIVAIGTVGSGLKLLENRPVFEDGIREMIRVLNPHTIIVYGSANYAIFNELREHGIHIISFPSRKKEGFDEQAKQRPF